MPLRTPSGEEVPSFLRASKMPNSMPLPLEQNFPGTEDGVRFVREEKIVCSGCVVVLLSLRVYRLFLALCISVDFPAPAALVVTLRWMLFFARGKILKTSSTVRHRASIRRSETVGKEMFHLLLVHCIVLFCSVVLHFQKPLQCT